MGIVDIQYDIKTKTWTAKPRFSYPGMPDFVKNIVHEGHGRVWQEALDDLIHQLPQDLAQPLSRHRYGRVYNSPERELGSDDRCVEVDGHWPSPQEFRKRHDDWVLRRQLGNIIVYHQVKNNQKQEEMEIQGKIIQVLPLESGVGRNGQEWKLQPYVLETQEQYPRKVYFEVFGADRIANCQCQVNDLVTVGFDLESREFNAKWYTTVRAWKVEKQVA